MTAGGELSGRLVLPNGVVSGRLRFGAAVEGIERGGPVPERFVLPGFVDAHVHGGGGGDVIDGTDGIRALCRLHARHGTTTLLPTTITRPWPEVRGMLRAVAAVRDEGVAGGAVIAGAHLEGPFISPRRLGAQPPFAIDPEPEKVRDAIAAGVVRVVTIAPELPGAAEAIDAFARAAVRVSLGHTEAVFETATAALNRVRVLGGVAAGTHLFNAMGGIAGREPGTAGAVLTSGHAFAELILDGHHVHAGSFRLASAMLRDRLMLVTDAMRGAGMGDGPSDIGGQAVRIADGVARLPDGTLAGSVLTGERALRNALAAGLDVAGASRLLSANPARYLGLTDRGEIRPGVRADLVVLDSGMAVQEVWIAGERVH